MALVEKTDLRTELNLTIQEVEWDNLLDLLASTVISMFNSETGRMLEEQEHTEYHNSLAYSNKVFLSNYPVKSQDDVEVWDDPDWLWADSEKIDAEDYVVDLERGIIFYNSYFSEGDQSIKVVYTAGYTAATLPAHIKQIIVRQACHWFQDAKNREWAVSSKYNPSGAGSVSYKSLVNNLLPDFVAMITKETRPNG